MLVLEDFVSNNQIGFHNMLWLENNSTLFCFHSSQCIYSRPNCYEKEVYSRGETTTHVVYTYLGKTSSFFFLLHPDLVHMVESGRVMAVSLVPVPVKKTFFIGIQ